jgi:hypothetical protein
MCEVMSVPMCEVMSLGKERRERRSSIVTVVVSMRSESQKDGSLKRQARRVTARRQRVANAFSNVTLLFTVRLAPTTF